jgi:hypothetical protein
MAMNPSTRLTVSAPKSPPSGSTKPVINATANARPRPMPSWINAARDREPLGEILKPDAQCEHFHRWTPVRRSNRQRCLRSMRAIRAAIDKLPEAARSAAITYSVSNSRSVRVRNS